MTEQQRRQIVRLVRDIRAERDPEEKRLLRRLLVEVVAASAQRKP